MTDAIGRQLMEALEPFAKAADIRLCGEWADDKHFGQTDVAFALTFGDLRRARTALEAYMTGQTCMEVQADLRTLLTALDGDEVVERLTAWLYARGGGVIGSFNLLPKGDQEHWRDQAKDCLNAIRGMG